MSPTAEQLDDPGPGFVAPRTAGPGGVLGIVLSLALLGVGAVLLHDGLVLVGAVGNKAWTRSVLDHVGTLTPTTAVAWIGAGLTVGGLALLVSAVVPRRRFGLRLQGDGGLYLREVDVARLTSGAARGVGGVLEASSTASRRRVVVSVRTTVDQDVGDLTRAAVIDHLSILQEPPAVVVRTRGPR